MAPIALMTAFMVLTLCPKSLQAIKLNDLKEPITEKSEEEAFRKLLEIESNAKSGIENLIRQILPTVLRLSSELELSGKCMGSMLKLVTALREMKLWAFRMVDSSGVPVGGVLAGASSAFGSYHQCLDVVVPQEEYVKSPPTVGQYCLANLRTPLPPRVGWQELFKPIFLHHNATFKTELMNFISEKYLFLSYDIGIRIGICVPSSCSKNEINDMIKLMGSKIGLYADIDSCEVKESLKLDKTQTAILIVLSSFIVVCIFATIYIEVKAHYCGRSAYDHEKKSYLYRSMLAFSIVVNFKNLMAIKPSQKRSLDCMNGMRYLSCTWVILGHTYLVYDIHMFRELVNFQTMLKDFFLSAITNGFLSVESFLFITSTLLSYTVVKHYDSSQNYNPILGILRRMWRLLPAIMLITGLVFLLPFVTSGPDYKEMVDSQIENCREYWWANVIYIANFLPLNKSCVPHVWYIAVDMQFFIVGVVYFLILFRKQIYGKIFLLSAIVISVIASGAVTYVMKYPPSLLIRYSNLNFLAQYAVNVYQQPHVHLGNYAVGLLLGTYLARFPKVKLSQWTCIVGWTVAILSSLAIVYAVYPWNNQADYTMVEAIAYSAAQRTSWGLCLGWLVLACYAGKGGYVHKILSWPGFQPLVKLTYLIYLVHLLVIYAFCFSRQGPQDFSNSTHVFNFFGILCVSHILAAILRLFYEAPCIEMERIFCSWLQSKPQPKRSKNIECHTERKPSMKMIINDENDLKKVPIPDNNEIKNGEFNTYI